MSKSPDHGINDQWIRQMRGPKNHMDPFKPYAFLNEKERTPGGDIEEVNTIFLTNRECRYSCLMCDLWINATEGTVPEGAIPRQIEWALAQLPPAKHLKLYNSANFFDPLAIPTADYTHIAELVEPFESLIVENHPLLTGERCLQFARMIRPRLQVAMGLETVHPDVLQKLNKKMNAEDFRRSAEFLHGNGISTRAFILLRPPFLNEEEGIYWARESLSFAFESACDCCTLIPTRAGNGAMDQLQAGGFFSPPLLHSLEEVLDYGINLGVGRVMADTWDLEYFSTCKHCFEERKLRIERINLEQKTLAPIKCSCG